MNANQPSETSGSPSEVFRAFLRLGMTSFGGPLAHLGFFHREFVEQRRWVSHARYGDLLSLCQILPGPTSSQMAFVLGLLRAGWWGALAAFVAFTLPSVLLLIAFALLGSSASGMLFAAVVHGLKLIAVCVVAQAIYSMAKMFLSEARRWVLALAATATMLLANDARIQIAVIVCGALAGALLLNDVKDRHNESIALPFGKTCAKALLFIFCVLLIGALMVPANAPIFARAIAGIYRAGALVFGGGHVVLPLLQETLVKPNLLSASDFLTGYGAAQVVPGPMFSLAAYLGMKIGGIGVALACTIAIFLPGFMLVAGVLPFWKQLAEQKRARSMFAGANAVVIGILTAAFYDPVATTAINTFTDAIIAAIGTLILLRKNAATLWTIAWCVIASVAARYVAA